jgi:antitoxin component YwqK of YwqJK toxin-antitoxin module
MNKTGTYQRFNKLKTMITQKITYYPNTYIIHEFFQYEDDQLTLYERYDLNEQLEYQKSDIMERNYLNGQPHGTCKGWFENGKLSSEKNYMNGQPHGTYKEWLNNGQLWLEGNYHNGKKHGLCKHWDINDNTICTETFYIHGIQQ